MIFKNKGPESNIRYIYSLHPIRLFILLLTYSTHGIANVMQYGTKVTRLCHYSMLELIAPNRCFKHNM